MVGGAVGVFLTLWLTQPDKLDLLVLARVGLAGACLVFLILSVSLRRLRSLVWGNVRRLFGWIGGLRITTRARRLALERSGYNARDGEVSAARKQSPRPAWRVSYRDGDDFVYVHNSGYWVQDVVVRADPDLFEFAGGASEGFIAGQLGDNVRGSSSGKQIPGRLTRKGASEGVRFQFSWTDQNGDRQPETSGEGLASEAALPPQRRRPPVRPTWQIGRPKQNPGKDVLVLANGAEGFVGKDVVIDADPSFFTFILKRELGDLAGIGILRFAGRPTEAGRVLGVTFTVTYLDANDEECTDHVPAEFGLGF